MSAVRGEAEALRASTFVCLCQFSLLIAVLPLLLLAFYSGRQLSYTSYGASPISRARSKIEVAVTSVGLPQLGLDATSPEARMKTLLKISTMKALIAWPDLPITGRRFRR
jgi:hypothetical protein